MHTSSRVFWQSMFSGSVALILLTTASARAQTLILGKNTGPDPKPSGTATINGLGTTVSDTFRFLGGADTTTTHYNSVTLDTASALTLQDGGTINTLFNFNASTADIYGGIVTTLKGYDSSVTRVYGGSVFSLTALGSSVGGLPGSGTIDVYGGSLSALAAQNGGVINIFGTGLTETFFASSSPFQIYDVTGTLQDGTALAVKYSTSGGTLLFNGQMAIPAVPEASTPVSFGLLLVLGLGGMRVAARKKKQMAKYRNTLLKTTPGL